MKKNRLYKRNFINYFMQKPIVVFGEIYFNFTSFL